jgi:hypothetical protein
VLRKKEYDEKRDDRRVRKSEQERDETNLPKVRSTFPLESECTRSRSEAAFAPPAYVTGIFDQSPRPVYT